MDASTINWMLVIASLLIGAGLGALGHRSLFHHGATLQRQQHLLAERERRLAELQAGVDEHFGAATRLVDALQRESDTLARRLAEDAVRLTSSDYQRRLTQVAPPSGEEEPPPPRDYADGTRGTLSEDFGLKSDADIQDAPQPPRY